MVTATVRTIIKTALLASFIPFLAAGALTLAGRPEQALGMAAGIALCAGNLAYKAWYMSGMFPRLRGDGPARRAGLHTMPNLGLPFGGSWLVVMALGLPAEGFAGGFALELLAAAFAIAGMSRRSASDGTRI
ncbi:MAG: hypothetical protein GMKNLPBB_01546 [Myxococcota bacterium]|nr:hypothetical protein [Myxococcota bacterium]